MDELNRLLVADDVVMVTVDKMPRGIQEIARVFERLAEEGVVVDMIGYQPTQSETISVSFTISGTDFARTLVVLGELQHELGDNATRVGAGNVKLVAQGDAMRDAAGTAAAIFGALAASGVEVKLITTSETEVSLLVSEADADAAARAIRERFGL